MGCVHKPHLWMWSPYVDLDRNMHEWPAFCRVLGVFLLILMNKGNKFSCGVVVLLWSPAPLLFWPVSWYLLYVLDNVLRDRTYLLARTDTDALEELELEPGGATLPWQILWTTETSYYH